MADRPASQTTVPSCYELSCILVKRQIIPSGQCLPAHTVSLMLTVGTGALQNVSYAKTFKPQNRPIRRVAAGAHRSFTVDTHKCMLVTQLRDERSLKEFTSQKRAESSHRKRQRNLTSSFLSPDYLVRLSATHSSQLSLSLMLDLGEDISTKLVCFFFL